jgi:hypothetical protein
MGAAAGRVVRGVVAVPGADIAGELIETERGWRQSLPLDHVAIVSLEGNRDGSR